MYASSKTATQDVADGQNAPARARGENSYDFVRFCAASAVLFSHHFDLAGLPEPRVPGYGEDFGELAVEIFFCLSGFLILRSLQKNPDWAHFAAARILRIFPNLVFVLVVTSAATLFWHGNYANLWPHAEYVIGNLVMFVKGVTFTIPGIFTDTIRPAVNDPLWTLPYELWCYALLFLLVIAARGRTTIVIVAAAVAVSIAWKATSALSEPKIGPFNIFDFFRLCSYFLSGALLAVFWPRIRNYALAFGVAGFVGVFLARNLLPDDTILVSLAVAAATIGLGGSRAMAWFSKGGDASYGMYVFAWPVQQFSLLLVGSFWPSMLIAFLVTAALGYATWHGFEKRALSYRDRLAERLRGGRLERVEAG